jgi:hypothetical protein
LCNGRFRADATNPENPFWKTVTTNASKALVLLGSARWERLRTLLLKVVIALCSNHSGDEHALAAVSRSVVH